MNRQRTCHKPDLYPVHVLEGGWDKGREKIADRIFGRKRRRLGPPPQILHLRCGNLNTIETQIWLASHFANALRELEDGRQLVPIEGP